LFGLPGTFCAAKGLIALLDRVAEDGAAASCTPRRHSLDGALEAVECHASLTLGDDDRLVVVVSTHITDGHLSYLSDRGRPFILLDHRTVPASVRVSTFGEFDQLMRRLHAV
jgi:hypothetical protein